MNTPSDKEQTSESIGSFCSFCGKSRKEVRTIVTSEKCAICDECIDLALETVSRQKGNLPLKIAYSVFRVVARFGWLLFRRRKKGTKKS